ncbi:TonB-dependent receptor [Sphingomonas lenta]|uniref:TonB-dependent receptor n=1 Tax=Sphingomonas lenta TaxID=1141887 RepID=A0A2A2SIM1_9SPHN|nr:TonB-dependent receptor [Sphingomonas lenta]PAX09068.1 hypothetical protein CKY28_07005 [Sphingomonas lenta]
MKPQRVRRLSVSVCLFALSAVAAPQLAFAQEVSADPQPSPADPTQDPGGAVPGDIVVTGIRQSLASSVARKREASQILDVITAEDIGKLPDDNIAESMQRVTGVQITRDRGEGFGINIRGLSSQTSINGRLGLGTRTEGVSARDVDFRNLAAEFFQAVEVFKTPVASNIEGSLGGYVNLVTRKPLDLKERTISVAGELLLNEYAERADPRASLFFADQFADGTLGVSVAANFSQRRPRTDFFQSLGGWQRLNVNRQTGFDFNADGVTTDVLRPVDLRFRTSNDTRTRYGVDGTVQWRPSSELELRIDGNYSRFENVIRNHFFQTLFTNNATAFVPGSLQIDENGSLLGATYNNQAVRVDGRYEPDVNETYLIGGNARWLNDRLTVEVDGNYSYADRSFTSQFFRFQGATNATVSYRFRGNDVPPEVVLTNPNGTPYDLTTPSLFVSDLTLDRVFDQDTSEYVGKVDVGYDLDAGIFRRIAGGARLTRRDIRYRVLQAANVATNARNPAFFDQATGRRRTVAEEPLSTFLAPFPFGDGVFANFGGNFPRSWLVADYDEGDPRFGSSQFIDLLNTRDFGGRVNSNPEQSDIKEDTDAAYALAELEGAIGSVAVQSNIGVRYVRTRLDSSGLVTAGTTVTPITVENDYEDWLPAVNLQFRLTPDVVLRFAGAKVIERPDIGQLSAGAVINQSSGTATTGNPQLNPFRADQYDVSLEWYTSRTGLLSIAGFYKDVANFVSLQTSVGQIPGAVRFDGGTDFLITRPFNAGGATIKGFEVGVQQGFDFLPGFLGGFGVIANYTFSDADTDSGTPIFRLSRHQYNIVGFYERDGLSARAAYNWRSRYALTGEGGNSVQGIGLFEYIAANGFLDASISYEFNRNLTLVLEGANLLNTKEIRYTDVSSRLRDLQINERRYALGVRVRF